MKTVYEHQSNKLRGWVNKSGEIRSRTYVSIHNCYLFFFPVMKRYRCFAEAIYVRVLNFLVGEEHLDFSFNTISVHFDDSYTNNIWRRTISYPLLLVTQNHLHGVLYGISWKLFRSAIAFFFCLFNLFAITTLFCITFSLYFIYSFFVLSLIHSFISIHSTRFYQ